MLDANQAIKECVDPTRKALRVFSEGYAWRQFTLTHADFQEAGLEKTIELFSLPAGSIPHGVKIKHSVAFSGGAIATYTIQVGITGTLNKYLSAFNVHQAPGDAAKALQFVALASLNEESPSAATSIKVTATSTVADLDASTAGSVDIWVWTSDAG